jgi:hypothetical protein
MSKGIETQVQLKITVSNCFFYVYWGIQSIYTTPNMKRPYLPFFLLLFTLLFTACSSASESEIIDPIEATYTKDVKTIIDNNCATSGCHSSSSQSAGIALSTFEEVKFGFTDLDSWIQIETNRMPKSYNLTPGEKEYIKNWIDNGYLE